jgi:hypothetical protein
MMQQSETVGAIAKALAEAQGEIENAHKNAKNPHFKSSYADLAEILNRFPRTRGDRPWPSVSL